MNKRLIFHLDMDAFFASVEILKNPALKGKPVIVGGQPDRRGVVSTCSYEARAFGVHSAMALSEAKRRCPHAIFLEGDHRLYREYSDRIMELLRELTIKVEVVSIDEAYIDLSEQLAASTIPLQIARDLKAKVYKETGLPCSIGVASNKLVAKMASAAAKPNGVYEVPHGTEMQFLAPKAVETIPGIGKKTAEILHNDGIKWIGDLQQMGMERLLQEYGTWGYHFFFAACGRDNRSVEWIEQAPKSSGAEITFETDQTDCSVIEKALSELTGRAHRHLCGYQMRCRGICLKLRDSDFKTITRSRMLFADTNHLALLQREALALFRASYTGQFPVRLIGISLHKLTDQYWQPTLWDTESF